MRFQAVLAFRRFVTVMMPVMPVVRRRFVMAVMVFAVPMMLIAVVVVLVAVVMVFLTVVLVALVPLAMAFLPHSNDAVGDVGGGRWCPAKVVNIYSFL